MKASGEGPIHPQSLARHPSILLEHQLEDQEHLESFLAQVEAETGARLPQFVQDEFDAFLECGILAHGF
jgi:hypothetical protein